MIWLEIIIVSIIAFVLWKYYQEQKENDMAEKQCPACKMMIDKKAKVCPHCRKKFGLTWPAKIFLALIILGFIGYLSGPSKDSNIKSPDATENRAFTAWAVHRVFIENALKAPSTADFAPQSKSSIETIEKNTYRISSYVDSQNSFGAKIRTRYSIILKDNGPNNWQLINVDFFSP